MIFKSLKKKEDFDRLFQKGKRFNSKDLCCYYLKGTQKEPRLAVVVSKKISKRAVDRNRIKRKIRALVLKNKEEISYTRNDILILAKSEILKSTFRDLERQFENLLKGIK